MRRSKIGQAYERLLELGGDCGLLKKFRYVLHDM